VTSFRGGCELCVVDAPVAGAFEALMARRNVGGGGCLVGVVERALEPVLGVLCRRR
jgi:hypothetical protein